MKSWMDARRHISWICASATAAGSAMPNRMLLLMVPVKREDSCDTKDSAERYERSDVSVIDLVSKNMPPDCGS